jgi:hypothetical protein
VSYRYSMGMLYVLTLIATNALLRVGKISSFSQTQLYEGTQTDPYVQ